ncbi:hypothetical protein [Nostoc linckia]|uniref:hypothetical protein n=1 Tax=Nostoc linckia TaxID=92942 RepID=UPI0015D49400|nr:hypothetical protein [Nostoc linckia]
MKPKTRKITFSVTQEIYEKLVQEAEKESRTLSGEILYIVNQFLASKNNDAE